MGYPLRGYQPQRRISSRAFTGSYQLELVRGVQIAKPDGSKRQLGIPTVLDRVIQQAILQIFALIYEPKFSNSSYDFRPNRSA